MEFVVNGYIQHFNQHFQLHHLLIISDGEVFVDSSNGMDQEPCQTVDFTYDCIIGNECGQFRGEGTLHIGKGNLLF